MQLEQALRARQELLLVLAEGDELFCAAGSLRLHPTGPLAGLPGQALQAGQAWRASGSGMVKVEALEDGRLRWTTATAPSAHVPKATGLRLWSRRPPEGGPPVRRAPSAA